MNKAAITPNIAFFIFIMFWFVLVNLHIRTQFPYLCYISGEKPDNLYVKGQVSLYFFDFAAIQDKYLT